MEAREILRSLGLKVQLDTPLAVFNALHGHKGLAVDVSDFLSSSLRD